MLIRLFLIIVCLVVLSASGSPAAEIDTAALQASIEKAASRYQEAFKARDAESLVKLFTPEAEYVDSSGTVFHGQAAIQAEFAASLANTPPGELKIEILSIRPIAQGLVVEEGVSTFHGTADGVASQVHYTATHVQQSDGTWLMASVRELGEPQVSPHDRLATLSWLIGAWREEIDGASITTEWKWSNDGNFLISEFSVHDAQGTPLQGTQRVGWDAERHQFRSWVFDSNGGTAAGWWAAGTDGTWSVQLNGTDAEGTRITGVLTYAHDGDGLVITQDQRTRAGLKLPAVTHRVVHQPPVPKTSH